MIDLTPLDVRKKRGDFRKVLRGYDVDEVDGFLEMVAERLEELVKENLTLKERTDRLQEQVSHQEEREQAVREALVTAQELRRDVGEQAKRQAEILQREAELEVESLLEKAERRLEERKEALEEMERLRLRFLKSFRALLERELDAVEVEEERRPLEDVALEIDFTVGELRERAAETAGALGEAGAPDAAEADEFASPEPAPEPAPGADDLPEPGATGPEDEDGSLWLSSILRDEDEKEGRKADDGG